MKKKLSDAKWFPYAVAACIAVVLYVTLTHLGVVFGAVKSFLGYFSAVFLACVIAYLMNPLAELYQNKLFKKIRNEKLRWTLSVVLAVASIVLFVVFLLSTLIPQLVDSVNMLLNNMDGYLESLQTLIKRWNLAETLNLDEIVGQSGNVVEGIGTYLMENGNRILNYSAAAGKGIVKWVIAFILSVYLLMAKKSLKAGAERLFRAVIPDSHYDGFSAFVVRCDKILGRYVIYSLLDALIIGFANAIFMLCFRMQYLGLVSLVVAVTNLIPTFGPIIGGAIGGFILLLVNPLHALIFIIFTLILQFLDGYVIKPKLFGNSLGVSGLLIIISVIVGGNMFGIVGILLAIPFAAILDFIYEEEILPALEKRRKSANKPPVTGAKK